MLIEGVTKGTTGFGGNDLNVNPNFTDNSRNMLAYDIAMGGDGNFWNTMLRFAQRQVNTPYTISKLQAWVRQGAKPRNVALRGSGRFGGDRGAIPFAAHRKDTIRLSSSSFSTTDSLSSEFWFDDSTSKDSMQLIFQTSIDKSTWNNAVLDTLKSGEKSSLTATGLSGTVYFRTLYNGIGSIEGMYDTIPVDSISFDGSGPTGIPVITQNPSNKKVKLGSTAMFSVTATGTTPFTYQWQLDSIDISGAININFTTAAVDSSMIGNLYRVIVSNITGSDTSSNAVLSVGSGGVRRAVFKPAYKDAYR
jgi:hypothetical protein